MTRRPPISTLFPSTTLFRSQQSSTNAELPVTPISAEECRIVVRDLGGVVECADKVRNRSLLKLRRKGTNVRHILRGEHAYDLFLHLRRGINQVLSGSTREPLPDLGR